MHPSPAIRLPATSRLALAAALLLVAGSAAALDFELARLDGKGYARLSELPPAVTLVNFWRADCPPCVEELPMLLDAAPHLDFRLVTVALQSRRESRDFWPALPADPRRHLALQGPVDARAILRRFANPSGALPHSALLDADGNLCATHSGAIDRAWLNAALARCPSRRSTS